MKKRRFFPGRDPESDEDVRAGVQCIRCDIVFFAASTELRVRGSGCAGSVASESILSVSEPDYDGKVLRFTQPGVQKSVNADGGYHGHGMFRNTVVLLRLCENAKEQAEG